MHGPNFPEPPPDIIEGEPEYEVEEIIGSRRTGKKRTLEFRVRWKGYSPAHDTWEPAAHIHAPELIKRYQMQSIGKALKSSSGRQLKSQHEDTGTLKNPSRRSARTLRPTEISNATLFETGHEKHSGTPAGNNTRDGHTKMGNYSLNSTCTVNRKKIKGEGTLAQEPSSSSYISTIDMSQASPISNNTTPDCNVRSYLELQTIEAYLRQETGTQALVVKTPDYLPQRDPHPEPITEQALATALAQHTQIRRSAAENAIRVARGGEMHFSDEDTNETPEVS